MTRTTWAAALLVAVTSALGCGATTTIVQTAPPPPPEDPDVVELRGELGNEFVQAAQPSEVIARLRVSGDRLAEVARPPINLGLVIDTSGSMEGDPIRDARDASLSLLDLLAPGDRLSVVAFNSRADVVLPSTEITGAGLDEVRAAIEQMQAHGTTDLAAGLAAGIAQVSAHRFTEGVNRIVLLGDGVPNDEAPIRPLAQGAGQAQIPITALGLGQDYNEVLMGEIAQLSGGHFHYVEDSSAVAATFRDEVLRLSRLVARGVMMILSPGPGVQIESVVGQSVTASGNQVNINVGDLAEGESRDVIVRMRAEGRREGASVELLDATLSFVDAVAGAGPLERRVFLGARATADIERFEQGRNAEVMRDAERMQAAAVVIEALRVARAGDYGRAHDLLEEAEHQLDAVGDLESVRLRDLRRSMPVAPAPPAPSSSARPRSAPAPAPRSEEFEARSREAHDQGMRTLQGR